MESKGWRTVQLPEFIVQRIEKQLKKKDSTHRNISDFITDKLRREFEGVSN